MRLRLIAVSLGMTLLVLAQSACGGSSISQEAASPTNVPGDQTSQSQPSLPASATAAVTPSASPSPKLSSALTPRSIDERTPASTTVSSETKTLKLIPAPELTVIKAREPDSPATVSPIPASTLPVDTLVGIAGQPVPPERGAADPALSQTAAIPTSEPAAPPPPTGTKVGNRIPDFTLKLLDGTVLTSANLRQRRQPAFLFFHGDW